MQLITRMCTSADGYVTTPDGWPAQLEFVLGSQRPPGTPDDVVTDSLGGDRL